ncbi:MAG: Flp pilus assembly complex ATPase component TadA [Thermoguttaceae bacterium]|nr:Flp pilus assembly complex ATPase component TadA [Thermoguttaceae bacterium]
MALRGLGQVLVDMKFISDEQLGQLREQKQRKPGTLLGQIAIEMGLINDDQLAQALGKQLGMDTVVLATYPFDAKVISLMTEDMAQNYKVIPLSLDSATNELTIAMSQPQNLYVCDELRNFLGYTIIPMVATDAEVNKYLEKYYTAGTESVEKLLEELESDDSLNDLAKQADIDNNAIDLTGLEAMADAAPVRKLLNMVILMAIRDRASDIHLEPFENEFKIRIRADGQLYELVPPPKHLAFAITTRVKVMANLDIAERRLPQDGRIELSVGGHPVDLRVSVLPTLFGESVVMRVLDRSVVMLDLDKIGMDQEILGNFRTVMRRPNGIVLVTGPTGSGKTTTLYAALSEMNTIEEKLITTEDPVEYDIDGIVQIPIDSSIGNTFAQCLRSILRQDPDRILVGEIRDLETAEIAIQAALTGHMVFSTLHTNDAPSTITRLRDMGIQPFLITATLEAVLAQRLVRRICTECKEETMPNTGLLADMDMTPDDVMGKKFYRGRGCPVCNNTGLKGRTGLHELLILNDRLRDLINSGCSTEKLRDAALQGGLTPLRKSGMRKVFSGETTLEEVVRETVAE